MKLRERTIWNNLILIHGKNKLKCKSVILIVFRPAEKALLALTAHHWLVECLKWTVKIKCYPIDL